MVVCFHPFFTEKELFANGKKTFAKDFLLQAIIGYLYYRKDMLMLTFMNHRPDIQ